MRAVLSVMLFGSAFLLLTACDPAPNVTYDNQTEYRLCTYPSEAASAEFCDEIEPNEGQSYLMKVCSGDDPLWITLAVGQGGATIYTRFATCGEWDGTTVTIQQHGDEFVVTDSLPGEP